MATVPRASDLKAARWACDAEKPLDRDDPRWQDLSPARGDHSVANLYELLNEKPRQTPRVVLFVGHRGAGKSTELNRLTGRLEKRYFPLYLVATTELDPNVLVWEDLLLVLCRVVVDTMEREGHALPADRIDRVASWFADVLVTTKWGETVVRETKAQAATPNGWFGPLLTSLTALTRNENEYRVEVRSAFRRYPGTLLDSVNQLLVAASQLLSLNGKGELLIVVDNMDRYPPEAIDALLVRGADRIKALQCDLLLTPPISLLYRPESESPEQHYHCEVMNAVRLRTPRQPYDAFDGPGRKLLLEALDKRLDLDKLIPSEKVRDRLVVTSGGSIRELLKLVFEATLGANGPVLTEDQVERVVRTHRSRIRDQVNHNGWVETLARIAHTHQINDDKSCRDVLYHRLALKYNGEGWYDVHPLVAELPEFRQALARLEGQSPVRA